MAYCPACGSSRIRNDYRPAPVLLRMFGFRALLCDNCNYQFRAFSPFPPKSHRPRSVSRKADVFNAAPIVDLNQIQPTRKWPTPESEAEKDARLDLLTLNTTANPENHADKEPAAKPQAVVPESPVEAPKPPKTAPGPLRATSAAVVTDQITPVRNDLRTEITKLYEKGVPATLPAKNAVANTAGVNPVCPECSSTQVKRRHRNAVEKAVLSLTDHKAFVCRDCGASFYAKKEEEEEATPLLTPSNAALVESSPFNHDRSLPE